MADDAALVALEALVALLGEAGGVAAGLAADPLLVRLLKVFHRLPGPDREVLIGVLEREAAWCSIVAQTTGTTGITVRPNPFASFYVQVVGPPPPAEPSERDIDVIRVGIERLLHLVPLLFDDSVHVQWNASARNLARLIDPVLGRRVVQLAREVVAIVGVARPELLEPGDP
jgi:hypothetical protein